MLSHSKELCSQSDRIKICVVHKCAEQEDLVTGLFMLLSAAENQARIAN